MSDFRILWPDRQLVRCHVEQTAKSRGYGIEVAAMYGDYCDPPVAHKLDLLAECDGAGICGCGKKECENTIPVGRLLVNEFPLHMVQDNRDGDVVDLFDSCECGPTASLGLMVEQLDQTDRFDLYARSGAILHLQNLEIREDLRRQGLGTLLLRYAVALLGRGETDLLVCEIEDVNPPYSALFQNDAGEMDWSLTSEIDRFLLRNFFTRAKRDDGALHYYRIIDSAERSAFLHGEEVSIK